MLVRIKPYRGHAEQEHLGLKFEYTTCKTPQHNGLVEHKYATLFGRAHTMMNDAGFIDENVHLQATWAMCRSGWLQQRLKT